MNQLFPVRQKTAVLYSTVLLLLIWCSPLLANVQNLRNILVLHSYHQGLQWTDNISAGINKEFQNFDGEIEVHFEYLDTKRIPGEEYFKHLRQFEQYKTGLSNIRFEVIISSDNSALRFIMDEQDLLYPNVPVVFCGVNNFQPGMLKDKKNITGVMESVDYLSTLQVMLKIHPDRRRVLVILDKTPTGNAIKNEFDSVATRLSDELEFEFYQDFILSEVPEKIKTLKDQDIIYLLTFNRDRDGTFISYVDGIKMIQKVATVPIYGSWDFYFGQGIVGGMITSGEAQGAQAAKMAKQILNGTRAEDIPFVSKSPNRYMFDYTQMKRFGIEKKDLPQDSLIINVPPLFIDRYKRWITVALGTIMFITLVLAWRLFIQKRRQVELIQTNIELDRRVAKQTKTLAQKNNELEREIKDRIQIEKKLIEKKEHLESALSKVKTLSGLLPICASCKKIRDDSGYWNQIESYINQHSDATFSHGICPDCAAKLYPELFEKGDLD
ncbi:MAG: ABC transporter substrate binding protein [Pseudomonadota bacterium]